MNLTIRNILATLLLVGAGFVLALTVSKAFAEVTSDDGTPLSRVVSYRFFATSTTDVQLATTTSATSTNITPYFDANGRLDSGFADIRGAEQVTLYFGRAYGGGNAGATLYKVQVSDDGTNWLDWSKLRGPDVSSTATTTYTISAATTTVAVSMDLTYDTPKYLRCIVVETTDGTHYCKATIEF